MTSPTVSGPVRFPRDTAAVLLAAAAAGYLVAVALRLIFPHPPYGPFSFTSQLEIQAATVGNGVAALIALAAVLVAGQRSARAVRTIVIVVEAVLLVVGLVGMVIAVAGPERSAIEEMVTTRILLVSVFHYVPGMAVAAAGLLLAMQMETAPIPPLPATDDEPVELPGYVEE